MAQGISKAVRETLGTMAYLHFAFEHQIANESALAKLIKPRVEEKLGRPVSNGAVIAAVRRALLTYKPAQREKNFFELLKSSKLFIRTGMVEAHFKRTQKTLEKLAVLGKKINWIQGEKMYVLQRTEELTIIADEMHLTDILACAPKTGLLSLSKDRAVITIVYDPYYFAESFGGLHFYTGQFAMLGIGIYLIFSTYSATSFVIKEKDAARAYKYISNALAEASKTIGGK